MTEEIEKHIIDALVKHMKIAPPKGWTYDIHDADTHGVTIYFLNSKDENLDVDIDITISIIKQSV